MTKIIASILYRASLFILAAFFVAYEIQMCLYNNFQSATVNIDEGLESALVRVRSSQEYMAKRSSYDSNIAGIDDAIEFMKIKNENMRVGAEPFVDRLIAAQNKKLQTIKERDEFLFDRFERPVIESYSLKRQRSLESNIFGLLRGITFGIAMPLGSLACMFFSMRFERKIWQYACVFASWVTQAVACYVSFDALLMQGGKEFMSAAYTGAMFLAAPLVYRGVVTEVIRSASLCEINKINLAEKKENKAIEEEERRKAKIRAKHKEQTEAARKRNLDKTIKNLLGGTNGVSLEGVPTDIYAAAQWFITKGKPYGMASMIARHCGKTPGRFSQVLYELSKEQQENA